MPISIICGACEAKLTAPDAAAGKKVKCPKCAVLLEIPRPEPEASSAAEDFEFVEEPAPKPAAARPKPAAAPAKPKPRPVLLESDDEDEDDPSLAKTKLKPILLVKDDDDDDAPPVKKPKTKSKAALVLDDEDDDRPRPKKKKGKGKAKKSSSNNLVILLAGGGVALVVVGVLVWYFAIHKPDSQTEVANNGNNPNLTPPQIPGQPNIPGKPNIPGQPGNPGGSKPPVVPSKPKPATGDWETYSSEDFEAWVPRGSKAEKSNDPTPLGKADTLTWSSPKLVKFNIHTISLTPEATKAFEADPAAAYDAYVAKSKEGLGQLYTLRSATSVQNAAYEGRQLDGDASQPGNPIGIRFRILVVKGKLFILFAGGFDYAKKQDKIHTEFFENFFPK